MFDHKSDDLQSEFSLRKTLNNGKFRYVQALKRIAEMLPKHIPIALKLSFVISLLITLGMVLLGSVVITNQEKLLRGQITAHGNTIASQLAESVKEQILASDKLSLSVMTKNMANDENILGTAVYDDKGTLLATSGIAPQENWTSQLSLNKGTKTTTNTHEWEFSREGITEKLVSFLQPVQFIDVTAGYVLITFSRASLDLAITDSVRAVTAATIMMIFIAIIISFVMARKISEPINYLMNASRAIDQGHFHHRIKERRNDEIGNLINNFNSMADGLLKKNQVEDAFSRFVSSNVAKQILSDLDNVEIGGEHVEGTVLFADIVGYTDISEHMTPRATAELLNEFFSYIGEASKLYNGTIDKFMGDCAMIVFGVTEDDQDHRFHAIACAVLIQQLVEQLNIERTNRGLFPVQFRLGINTGEMLAGNMGCKDRMEFTVVGDAVNLASRLCTFAAPGEIVINKDLYQSNDVSERVLVQEHMPIQLRSRKNPVLTYLVEGLASEYQSIVLKQTQLIVANKVAA